MFERIVLVCTVANILSGAVPLVDQLQDASPQMAMLEDVSEAQIEETRR